MRPPLSVVVAAWHDAPTLARCLDALRGDGALERAEVIVVRNFDDAESAAVAARHPRAVHLVLARSATVPQLRAAGLARSAGEHVAFIEDHAAVAAGWSGALLRAHAAGHAVVGGPVANDADASALEWAVYLYDYGRYAPPCASGSVTQLSGINCSYTRDTLHTLGELLTAGVHEDAVQSALRARGCQLFLDAEAVVVQRGHHTAVGATTQAYHLARGYAARRRTPMGRGARAARALGSALLPFVMLSRIGRRSLGAPGLRKPLLRAFPWLAMLVGSWSLGEAIGYAAGAGHSDAHWR